MATLREFAGQPGKGSLQRPRVDTAASSLRGALFFALFFGHFCFVFCALAPMLSVFMDLLFLWFRFVFVGAELAP